MNLWAAAASPRVELRDLGDRRVAVKHAEGAPQVEALRRESELLRRATNPAVVGFVSFDDHGQRAELVMAAAGTSTLVDSVPTDPAAVFSIVAILADALADLHGIGIVHGAVRPEHVVVTGDGRVQLCGFGSARMAIDPELYARDVRGLATLIEWLAESNRHDATLAGRLRQLAYDARADDLNARAVAVAATAFAGRREHRSPIGAASPLWRTAAGRAAGVIVGIGLVVALATSTGGAARSTPPAAAPTTSAVAPAPIVERGRERYVVGLAGDRALVGDWDCQGERVAILRPATGDVYVFADWATHDAPTRTTPLARVPAAHELRTETGEDCSRLVATTDQGPVSIPTTGA